MSRRVRMSYWTSGGKNSGVVSWKALLSSTICSLVWIGYRNFAS